MAEPPTDPPPESLSPGSDPGDRGHDDDPRDVVTCDICGARMGYLAPCKIVCGNCGYTRDCSDP